MISTDEQIICEECMSYIPLGKPECPYCGRSFANTNPLGSVPLASLLHGYTMGKMVAQDAEGVTYDAIHTQSKKRVFIKEFAPAALCCARDNEGNLIVRDGKEVLYKTVRMDYKEMYTKLELLRCEDGLVCVCDVFDANGTTYGVYENEKTITLFEYIKSRKSPLSSSEVLALLRPLTSAVRAMHSIGIVHRGISPNTVYITQKGEAKLGGYATLGIRTMGSELECELFDGFSAPEQYSVAEFDGHYTDIYALGALYYFAITAKLPHSAQKRKANDTMPCVRNLAPHAPAYISSAIQRAMRIVPTERMQTVDAFMRGVSSAQKRGKHRLNETQKMIAIAICGTVSVITLLAIMVLVSFLGDTPPASSSISDSASSSQSVPSAYTAPDFVGKLYSEVQADTQYVGELIFTVEEAYSSVFRKGEIMEQTPAGGSAVGEDRVITLKVSLGAKTATMPAVVGMPRVEAKALLESLGIKHYVIALENDGSYMEDTVAKTDVTEGTEVNIDSDIVVLYVANAPKAPSSSAPGISASTVN